MYERPGETEDAGLGEFDVDSPEFEAAEFVRENYGSGEGVVAQLVIRDPGGNVLTRESLLDGLRLQEAVLDEETTAQTLTEQGLFGIENLVATGAVFEDAAATGEQPPSEPSVTAQREALEQRTDEEVEQLLASLLDPDSDDESGDGADPFEFLSRSYEPGEATAESRLVFISQIDDSGDDEEPEAAYDAQLSIAELVDDRFDDAFVFGQGISNEASSNATGDSFAIITPFALVLLLFVLGVSYRDVIDILLAILGIVVVMAWLAGLMGSAHRFRRNKDRY